MHDRIKMIKGKFSIIFLLISSYCLIFQFNKCSLRLQTLINFPLSQNFLVWSCQTQFWFVYIHLKHSCKGHHLSNSNTFTSFTAVSFSVPSTQPVSSSKALFFPTFSISFSMLPLSATNISLHQARNTFSEMFGWNIVCHDYHYHLTISLHSPISLLLLFYFTFFYPLVDRLSFA